MSTRARVLGAMAVGSALCVAGVVAGVAVVLNGIESGTAWLDGGWRRGDVAEWDSFDGLSRGTVLFVGPAAVTVLGTSGECWILSRDVVRRVVA